MKLIAQVKLQPSREQAQALQQTMLVYNEAANYISSEAWMRKTFKAYDLHHATYYAVRERFGLAAQLAVRVIKDVADAYKLGSPLGPKSKRTFRKICSLLGTFPDVQPRSRRDDPVERRPPRPG